MLSVKCVKDLCQKMYQDSTGTPIKIGDTVRFRGEIYTIKEFISNKGIFETAQIVFNEPQHTNEIADEINVDLYNQPIESDSENIMPLKSLEDHNKEMEEYYRNLHKYPKPNGLACPICGKELADSDGVLLISMPPKRRIYCPHCGYMGYRIA